MIQSRGKSRDPDQQRRDEINEYLEQHGFVARRSPVEADADDHMQRLCALLQALGPVFASFGLYLASRPDLLSLSDCVLLANIPNRANATPAASIRQIIDDDASGEEDEGANGEGDEELSQEVELDDSDQFRFTTFDAEPVESRLLFQLHHGQLENGELVVVKVIHPTLQIDQDVRLMPLVARAVASRLIDPKRFTEILASFDRALAQDIDCEHAAESLAMLAHDTRDNESLRIPKVYHALCSRNVLVSERLDGMRLDVYVANCRASASSDGRSAAKQSIVPDELARLLCDAWLYQAFQGTMLPVDFCPANILIRSPTEIAIVDGTFENLPAASRRNLLNYFIAVATDEPSKSLACLVKEMDASHGHTTQSTLDRQFRQLVAFRDGGWEDGGRANCLSDTLFAQWRLAVGSGFRPLRHLTHFFRGTFHLAYLARQVAPDRDSLLEGVKDLRLTKLLNDIGTMMEPSYWGGQADRLASLMILGPQHLDDALKKISSKDAPSTEHAATPAASPKSTINPVLLALFAILLAFLFRDEFIGLVDPVWAERITGILFIAMGGLALRLLVSPGKS